MSLQDSDSDNKNNVRRSKRLSNHDDMVYFSTRKNKKPKIEISSENVDSNSTNDDPEKSCTDPSNSFCLCESCGYKFVKKFDKKGDFKGNKCSPCKKKVKELSSEYIDDNNKTCENCKGSALSSENKMIGCLICMKYYHVNCLLTSDVPHDLKFESGQFIRRKLGCIRCAVVHLCYKVSNIVTWRWRKEALGISNPAKYYMPREFLIHYSNMSYWDCEWVSEVQLEISETNLYRAYKRKGFDFSTAPSTNILSVSHKRKMSEIEIKLHEEYFQWGIDPEWLQPQKVLGMDDVGCFVKWRGLGYEFVSTEPLTRVPDIDGMQEVVDKYSKFIKELTCGSWQTRDKAKLTKLSESPEYLGPTVVTSKDRPALHPYQLEGVNWLRSSYANNINTILADEMGLGKTIQAIALLYSLYKDKVSRGPFLITVPLSTIKNWEREFEFWAPDFCVVLYYGDKDTRLIIRDKDIYYENRKKNIVTFHVLLTTYELIYMDESFLTPIHWEILIVDEAHRLKNNETKLFKSLKKYNINYRILMTGTPLQNNLEELFHLLNFMEPDSFGDITAFLSQFEDVSKEDQVRTLQEMLKKHILRRLKSDVLIDLPTKEEQIVRVELTPFQKNLYKLLLTKNYEFLTGKFSGIKLTSIVMQLRKCCNHPYLVSSEIANENNLEDGSYHVPSLIAVSGKMNILQIMLSKLKETEHKVLIFSGMTKLLDILEHFLDYMNIQFERIDGSVSSISRQAAIDRFNDPESISKVFLLSTKAGGLGINLSSADTVFIYDADWNPQNDIQALSRAHRIGQKRKVMIYRFVTRNSIEEKIMETAKRKMMVTNLVVKSFTKLEFHQILSFGTKELFEDNDEKNEQKIIYDDAAIEQLLDRNRVDVSNSENSFVDSCFSGFKLAQYQFANESFEIEEKGTIKENIEEEPVVENATDFWTSLLDPHVKNVNKEENLKEPTLGKGFRVKKKINYNTSEKNHNDPDSNHSNVEHEEKDPDDTDYDISEGGNAEQLNWEQRSDGSFILDDEKKPSGVTDGSRVPSRFNIDRDFKELGNYGVSADLTQLALDNNSENNILQYKYFSIVNGFMPKERMEIYNAIMNYGLPPKVLKKSEIWWPSALEHKSVDEVDKFITTLMSNLTENYESYSTRNDDPFQHDGIDCDLFLARIGMNGLINYKVNQYEGVNRTILEMVTYKNWNVRTMPIEELEKLFDELGYFEFIFNIFDGGFSKIQNVWNEYYSKLDKSTAVNPTLKWNKLHDYYILSAISCHGYDEFLEQIFNDPQYQILFIPARMANLDLVKDNQEIRKFLRERQSTLENALLLEAQIMKIGSAFDGFNIDFFSNERLRHYHDLFVKQGTNNYITPAFANTKNKITAITQLELLINDVESNVDSFRPISLRQPTDVNIANG